MLALDDHLSAQRTCRVVRLSRTGYYRPPQSRDRAHMAVIVALTATVSGPEFWDLWMCLDRVRFQARRWNYQRLYRV